VEWNLQGKTKVLGEKPVPVPLCPPQTPRGLTRDRNRASAVEDRRLTAWALARPCSTDSKRFEICDLLGYYTVSCGNCGKQLPHDAV
jgi:hypothetical protein